MLNFPFDLPYATYLTFTNTEKSEEADKSNVWKMAVKQDRTFPTGRAIQKIADRIADQASSFPWISEFLGDDVLAIPVPGSGVHRSESLWVAKEICDCLLKANLIGDWKPVFKRTVAVPKSSFSRAGDRPDTRKHYESIEVDENLIGLHRETKRILIVDDVVTRGCTLAGCFLRLAERQFIDNVRCFAFFSTRNMRNFSRMEDPTWGAIRIDRFLSVSRNP